MHERKVEMAKRVGAFVGLPGGFGSFEEVLQNSSMIGITCRADTTNQSDHGGHHVESTQHPQQT